MGYGVSLQGAKFTLNCRRSHPVIFEVPAGLKVEVQVPQARGETEPAKFTVSGPDEQAVGEFAARVRRGRKPEPYKGKGVRYAGEYVRRQGRQGVRRRGCDVIQRSEWPPQGRPEAR